MKARTLRPVREKPAARRRKRVPTSPVSPRKFKTYGSLASCPARSESAEVSCPAKFDGAAPTRCRVLFIIWFRSTFRDQPWVTVCSAY